jgi:hypothetical protein
MIAPPVEGTGALATAGSGATNGSTAPLEGTAALPAEGTAAIPAEGTTPVVEPPDAGPATPPPARDAGTRPPRDPVRETTSTGSLTLVLNRTARVSIDGRERGEYSGSVRLTDIPVGLRTIRGVSLEGGVERTISVDIVPGLNRARLTF